MKNKTVYPEKIMNNHNFVNGLLIENGSLVLAGDFLFNMPNTETAIKAGNLTLRSGTLTVVGCMYGI